MSFTQSEVPGAAGVLTGRTRVIKKGNTIFERREIEGDTIIIGEEPPGHEKEEILAEAEATGHSVFGVYGNLNDKLKELTAKHDILPAQ